MTCPFCRCEIRCTEQIVVDPFYKDYKEPQPLEPDAPPASAMLRKFSSTEDDDSFEVSTLYCQCVRVLMVEM